MRANMRNAPPVVNACEILEKKKKNESSPELEAARNETRVSNGKYKKKTSKLFPYVMSGNTLA